MNDYVIIDAQGMERPGDAWRLSEPSWHCQRAGVQYLRHGFPESFSYLRTRWLPPSATHIMPSCPRVPWWIVGTKHITTGATTYFSHAVLDITQLPDGVATLEHEAQTIFSDGIRAYIAYADIPKAWWDDTEGRCAYIPNGLLIDATGLAYMDTMAVQKHRLRADAYKYRTPRKSWCNLHVDFMMFLNALLTECHDTMHQALYEVPAGMMFVEANKQTTSSAVRGRGYREPQEAIRWLLDYKRSGHKLVRTLWQHGRFNKGTYRWFYDNRVDIQQRVCPHYGADTQAAVKLLFTEFLPFVARKMKTEWAPPVVAPQEEVVATANQKAEVALCP